ncbi:MAG: hypothetical protein Q9N68_07720 [Gammaproteobacteria bacterium]|nr:hypothetical protein [Gammaproteobacteria bacterium]
MSFFKTLFGSEKDAAPARRLEHPKNLQIGDIAKFGFAAQAAISNQSFVIEDVHSYDLGGEQKRKTVFTTENSDGVLLRLAVIEERHQERLEIAIPLLPDDVQQIFDIDAFVDLLNPDTGTHHVLERIADVAELEGWTAPVYRQEQGHNAYFYDRDYRGLSLPEDADEGTAFSYYLLVSDDREYALEVQVFDGGQTEVYLLAYLAVEKIEELWPAKAEVKV